MSQRLFRAAKPALATSCALFLASALHAQEPADFELLRERWQALEARPQTLDPAAPLARWRGALPWGGPQSELYLVLEARALLQASAEQVPTPTGLGGSGPVDPDYFGDSSRERWRAELSAAIEVFQREAGAPKAAWGARVTPVVRRQGLNAQELGIVSYDLDEGESLAEGDFGLQEAWFEFDLPAWSSGAGEGGLRLGIQPVRGDPQAWIYSSEDLGLRAWGEFDAGRCAWSVAVLQRLDRHSDTLLVDLSDEREAQLLVASLRQADFPAPGWTSTWSLHHTRDDGGIEFDDGGNPIAPQAYGAASEHRTRAWWLGWNGTSTIGEVEFSSALFQAFGSDSLDPLAARRVTIDAQLAAVELHKPLLGGTLGVFALYASGDRDARDGRAQGFDGIDEQPRFGLGSLSLFGGRSLPFLGVELTQPGSPFADLQASGAQGQPNFVNPGLWQLGLWAARELRPRLELLGGCAWMRFAQTDALETALGLNQVESEIGVELVAGLAWQPWEAQSARLQLSYSRLEPGAGLERIYASDDTLQALTANLSFGW